ncbi:hypothetical protein ACS0PU_002551 [Formica fusca]
MPSITDLGLSCFFIVFAVTRQADLKLSQTYLMKLAINLIRGKRKRERERENEREIFKKSEIEKTRARERKREKGELRFLRKADEGRDQEDIVLCCNRRNSHSLELFLKRERRNIRRMVMDFALKL